ncbi:hypothetical protein MRB53_018879 [Persea americana]|uniref:Uncharacterized protein n=1 Tax=Persea americana TaxID=3435 RepID=A0ACC2M951_PERAE|nr:hypothetical protein MRB53_018879 [Persea americana]
MNFFHSKASCIFSRPFSLSHQVFFNTVSAWKSSNTSEAKGLEKALKLLDLINPQTSSNKGCGNHLRLVQGCMQQLSKARVREPVHVKEGTNDISDWVLDSSVAWQWMASNNKGQKRLPRKDALLVFVEMHNEGMRADPSTLSGVLSSCGGVEALDPGMQLHGLAIKAGLDGHVSVGTSLISLYAKCQRLDDAYLLFEKMPVRNTVSWTAIISGFAQNWQFEMCLELFHLMRQSMLRPNDITFASLLSACTGSSSLGQGRSSHCLVIHMGFDSYVHVANSLISMYAKCGRIEEALYVFEKMPHKDIISWNSMIAGYAQHGLANEAIKLFGDMKEQKITPDAITFLSVLSSCRHVGLIEQGRLCFDSMLEYGVEPELDHYSCMVDLLGRAGLLEEAYEFIQKMPIHPNSIIWGSLLSSCSLYGNVLVGIQAAERRLSSEPSCAAAHVQLANLYASVGCWNHVARVRKLMKEKCLKPSTGYSWIEIGNEVFRFRAEDRSNTNVTEIFAVVDSLAAHMRSVGHMPKININLNGERDHL